ncbi:MAG: ATP-dependent DNA ligase [Candidatus Diapherotrites archaeon]|nr:ATP-dependent DNA ligase [Candidatus Diapherotrites archaeon]
MQFLEIAEAFEQIEKTGSRIGMTELLAALFKKAKPEELQKIVYLCQGSLGPQYNSKELGLGENLVIDSIAKATGHGEAKIKSLYKEKGDLGLVAMELAGAKAQKSLFSQPLDLEKVFSNLQKISQSGGSGSQELKKRLVAELLNSASQLEAKFITRIALESLRLGAGDPTIMDALAENNLEEFKKTEKGLVGELSKKYSDEELHRQIRMKLRERIEAKYNIHSDLGFIAKLLAEKGLKGLDEISIQIGIPIRPTLAERLPSAQEIIDKLGECAVEAKIDGFRLQVHREKDKVIIFSRRQEDMTKMFPEIVEAVKKQLKPERAIIEGEAIAYSEESDEFQPFQVTIQRKRKYEIGEFAKKFPLRLFVFDVMLVGEKNMMGLPFRERRKEIEKIIAKGDTVKLTDLIITKDPEELNKYFNLNVQKGLEGIIAKDLDEKYIAGARKFAWIKLKRSYKGELSDTVDAVIIGYYKGKGQRTEFGLGTLLAAVYNEELDRFESVAKIGTGMSEKQLVELEAMLKKIAVKQKPARVESGLEPDVWAEPKYVIEVRADEITESPVHVAAQAEGGNGLALRFPRMISLRVDRKPEEATTSKELREMFVNQRKTENLEAE